MKTALENLTIQESFNRNSKLCFSRISIYKDNVDTITGFVLKDQVLEVMINGKGIEK